jgi:Cu-Zn family superoxide dismutase
MKKRLSATAAVLLITSSSLVSAAALRHVAWDGMVLGKGASKIRGLTEMVGGTVKGTTAVSVSIKGDVPGATRPWHVHIGSCKKAGAILGGANAYTPLTVQPSGAAESKSTLRLALPDSGEFYVSVHESVAKMGTVIACGDLLLED